MSRFTSRIALSVASGLGLALITASVAPAAQRCTGFTAISTTSADALCACTTVTSGFIRAVQSKHRFPAILAATSARCPGLANLLSDQPTAAPGSPFPGPREDGETSPVDFSDEPEEPEEPEYTEGDECGYEYDDDYAEYSQSRNE